MTPKEKYLNYLLKKKTKESMVAGVLLCAPAQILKMITMDTIAMVVNQEGVVE